MDAVSSKHCVGTPGLEYPLLLCLGKSLVVIHNYALTAERPDPCCPEPYSPGKRPWTHSPLGKGPVAPRIPGAAVSQNSWGPRTSRGAPNHSRSPGPPRSTGPLPGPGPRPPYTIRTPQRSRTYTLPGAGPEPPRVTCPRAGAGTRAGPRGFRWKSRLPTAFNAVGRSAHCHNKARGGFGQVALLVACYQGAQSSRWRRLL